MDIDVLVVSAVEDEGHKLLPFMTEKSDLNVKKYMHYTMGDIGDHSVAAMLGGVGAFSIAATTALAIRDLKPKCAIFMGVASGIQTDSLAFGDVVIVDKVFSDESLSPQRDHNYWENPLNNKRLPPFYYADPKLLKLAESLSKDFAKEFGISVHIGTGTSSDYFPFPPWFEEHYRERDTLTIDLESAPFASVCWLFDIPFIIVRGISNIVDKDSHFEFTEDSITAPSKAAAQFTAKLILG